MIKNLILSCLAMVALVSLAACSDDERHSSTSESSATTLNVDTKDVNHPGHDKSH